MQIRCYQEEHRTYEHKDVEDAMHVAFVYSEEQCAYKTGYKPEQIYKACCKRDARLAEIRREESRKHQAAYNKRGCNGHFAEDIEAHLAENEYGKRYCKRHAESYVSVCAAVHKASCRCACNDVEIDGGEIHFAPYELAF